MAKQTRDIRTVDEINAETKQQQAERAKAKAAKDALTKAQKQNKRAKIQADKEHARVLLKEAGYTRPVILFNKKTGECINGTIKQGPRILTYTDPYDHKTYSYEIRQDGKCTSDEVLRVANQHIHGDHVNLERDSKTTSKKTYGSNPKPEQLSAWGRNTGRYDIEGIDAPRGTATIPSKKSCNNGKCRK